MTQSRRTTGPHLPAAAKRRGQIAQGPAARRPCRGRRPFLAATRGGHPITFPVWIALSAVKRTGRLTRRDVVRAAAQLRRIDEATADILLYQRSANGAAPPCRRNSVRQRA
jgi:hypothetical protein